MSKAAKPVPEGHHTVTPYLTLRETSRAIEFYKKAFGAQEVMRMAGPGGKGVVHAEIKIGDSLIFMGDEFPQGDTRAPETPTRSATTGVWPPTSRTSHPTRWSAGPRPRWPRWPARADYRVS